MAKRTFCTDCGKKALPNRLLCQKCSDAREKVLFPKRSRKRRGLSGLGEVTKKDFIGVADALCRTGASDATITAVGNYFDRVNPNFKHAAFHAAAKRGCK